MGDETKISVIIPTYNEEANIITLLNETHRVLSLAGISHELIIVDDASKDNTRAEIKKLAQTIPEITLIERDNERGLASAMVKGYNAAKGQYLGAMDADLAHDPKHLPMMVGLLDTDTADLIIGSRYLPESQFFGKPLINKIASVVGQLVIKLLLNMSVNDTSNNYRVFKKEIWEVIKDRLHPDGNIMLTEIIYQAQKNNYRLKEIPIIYQERRIGKSKLNILAETIRFFKNIIKIKNGR